MKIFKNSKIKKKISSFLRKNKSKGFVLFFVLFFCVFFFLLLQKSNPKKPADTISDTTSSIINNTNFSDTALFPSTTDTALSSQPNNASKDFLVLDNKDKKIDSKKTPKSIEDQLENLLIKTVFQKKKKSPKIFVVIDDIGYSAERAKSFLTIAQPITFAILPNLPQSSTIARFFYQNNKSILLHMPMEPKKNRVLEKITLLRNDNSTDIRRKIIKSLNTVPHFVGISNHMGSSFTENFEGMNVVMQYLKQENLFFLDSKTGNSNLSKEIANQYKITYYARDIFLDNSKNRLMIAKQLIAAAKLAFRNGSSIAIGHPYKQTYQVLAILMPKLEQAGIQFQDFALQNK